MSERSFNVTVRGRLFRAIANYQNNGVIVVRVYGVKSPDTLCFEATYRESEVVYPLEHYVAQAMFDRGLGT